jgi:cleavage stimulation factor subunit 2
MTSLSHHLRLITPINHPHCASTMAAEKNDVFVGNLAYNTSIDILKEIFSKVGNVVNVRIVTDRETGRPRGFAFVEYEDAATALSAIRNLDGHDLNGRKVLE